MWLLYPFVIPLYSTQLHPEAAYHPGCLLVVQGLGFIYVLIYTVTLLRLESYCGFTPGALCHSL